MDTGNIDKDIAMCIIKSAAKINPHMYNAKKETMALMGYVTKSSLWH